MELYGLIGKKLGHSFSAKFFNDKFMREGIDARYALFEIPSADSLPHLIEEHPDLKGLNVTIPYKQDVIPMLDSLTDSAREIGAVNTILVTHLPDGGVRLDGHNTDAPGFMEAIRPMLHSGCRRALVLGQGGASLAVIYALRRLGIEVTKVSRTRKDDAISYGDLNAGVMCEHQVIVNCTPLGMWPDTESCPDIPYDAITEEHVCFDLVYNPEVTEFMRRASEHGATVSNGLEMLHNQAVLAWKFWNGL